MAWHAKETVRGVYRIADASLASQYTRRLAADLQHESCPPEINQLGRTIRRRRHPDRQPALTPDTPTPPPKPPPTSSKESNASPSDSAASPTTGSEPSSTPGNPTGTYSPYSPLKSDEPVYRGTIPSPKNPLTRHNSVTPHEPGLRWPPAA